MIDPRRPRQCVSELATLIDLLTREVPGVDESEVVMPQPMDRRRYGNPLLSVPVESHDGVADGVASVLAAALNRSEYESVDIAVLVENSLMLQKVERKLKASLSPDRYLDSRLTVVNLTAEEEQEAEHRRQFDVVVVAATASDSPPGFWQGGRSSAEALGRTLALAAARTRHQLIVVHAIVGDFPASDPRGLLVDGFAEVERLSSAEEHGGSLAERVASELEALGYDARWRGPIPARIVGASCRSLGPLAVLPSTALTILSWVIRLWSSCAALAGPCSGCRRVSSSTIGSRPWIAWSRNSLCWESRPTAAAGIGATVNGS